ncbi:response regulator transcription factor [Acuticoccus sp. I52.16.1]|uniref:response regulator transcription factor n=1 Tax=Acuticoccus sp. I52.16.1 TaxID=2928472 RepID=UPI001FD31E3F|nr:response regulator transcription factor [Acuticoccus sp. I52.16.1]UOM36611.1 response regulator transcription factor [Acuticoccus sp. I52.16.1]
MERERTIHDRRPASLARSSEAPCVFIVDDDPAVREGITELILSAGFQTIAFGSTQELFDAGVRDVPGCLILDVRMPGTSGLDLQNRLAESGDRKPVIFLTGHGDIPMTVQAMKCGAVDFLTKPVRDQALLDAVLAAIAIDTARRAEAAVVQCHVSRIETLTRRERQVLREVARGRLNKQIAFDLGISEVTVKLHRGNAMRKMEVPSLAALIRLWETLPPDLRDLEPR